MRKTLLLFILALLISSFTILDKEKGLSNFKLKNASTNKLVALSDYKKAKGFILVFTCNKCPMAKLYTNTLNALNAKYKKLGVPLIAINSMDTLAYAEESFKKMQLKVKKEKFNFPYLQDKNQIIVRKVKAKNTPQAFLIWKNKLGNYDIKYQGAINDNASEPEKAEHNYIANAVNELLKGKQVTTPKSESFGCRIFIRGEKQKMD
ncbi:thioredoxin family protein [Flavobacterium sp. SUN052]|uniref:thioredoxin family protein n=1 Tax=Flavobacterium sp. SUN052 TaxID=3002441 RepID=UPI00237E0B8E|nr:thioredoxin family protein [Flavobacterium sp. SUN052]MEC4003478.1 thioredoxin family protein [Flavobacterium sp. SUN052]